MPYFARAQGDPFPFLGAIATAASPILKRALGAGARAIFGKTPLTKASQIITRPLGRALGVAGTVATGATVVQAIRGGSGGGGGGGGGGGRRERKINPKTGKPYSFKMNVANPKALRRAIRREQGFVKLARRTLRGTGFTISRRGFASKKKTGRR